jgi:hypothetical protein
MLGRSCPSTRLIIARGTVLRALLERRLGLADRRKLGARRFSRRRLALKQRERIEVAARRSRRPPRLAARVGAPL